MNFVSFAFAALFAVVVVVRLATGWSRSRTPYYVFLTGASLVFYGWHVPAYVVLLLFSTGVDYWVGKRLAATEDAKRRRSLLTLSVIANLGLLGFYKYADFLIDLANRAGRLLGMEGDLWKPLGLALPIGISFYTFQSMSYTIDIYRRRIAPVDRFRDLLLFVSFFPQLVAGPIVRASDFLYQLKRWRPPRARVWLEGTYQIILGFFLKMVVADNLAIVIDPNWRRGAHPDSNGLLSLLLAFFFTCQIFADFAGYTCIARGVAYWLGFRLPINFNAPYIARSFREFWRRWHITLSSWLRDYLYIPLGGNRRGKLKGVRNLVVVMLLGGLWHGAAMTFVAWGALHGAALGLERFFGLANVRNRLARFSWAICVQVGVLSGWIFFRSDTIGEAIAIVRHIIAGRWQPLDPPFLWSAAFTLPVVVMHLRSWLVEHRRLPNPGLYERAMAAGVMIYLTVTAHAQNHAFLYFQF